MPNLQIKKLFTNRSNTIFMTLKNPINRIKILTGVTASMLIFGSVFAFALPGISQQNQTTQANSAAETNAIKKVKTIKLDSAQSSTNLSVNFDGKITNETEVRISASTPATVKSVNFTRGKTVKKGEVLATLGGKSGSHPLQIAVQQAQVNLSNLDTNLKNLGDNNQNSLDRADQQLKTLNTSLTDLNKTFDLTKDSSKITIAMSEQSLKSLEGDIARQDDAVKKSSDSINGSIEAQKAGAKAFIEQTSVGLVGSLNSLSLVIPGIYTNELSQQINDLNSYKTVDVNSVSTKLVDFQGSLNSLITFIQKVIKDGTAGVATNQTLSLLSTSASSAKAQAVSQAANLNTTGVSREAQTSQGVNALDSLKSKRTDLQMALDKAKNATAIQEQATIAQINSLNQQIENAKLLQNSALIGAQTQLDTIEGQRKLLELQLQNAQSQLSGLTITSPIDGIVTDVKITAGQDVSAGLELVTIYGTGGKYVRGYLKPKDVEAIDTSKDVELTLSGDNNPSGTAKVTMLYPVADSTTGLIPVDFEIVNQTNEQAFAPGAKIEGKFKSKNTETNKQSITISTNSVSLKDGQKFVLVVENGKVAQKTVVLGPSNGDQVEIISGLKGDEEVILTDLNQLQVNQSVEVEK
jgi:RND family efflux transporter MFP subunit